MKERTFLGIPADVWFSSLFAFAVGVIILFTPAGLEHLGWVAAESPGGHAPLWKEIVRDIGIAFLVASIVSIIYEWSTRVAAEHQKITGVLSTVMSAYVTEELWNEVNREVFRRSVVRRSLEIDLTLTRDEKLAENQMRLETRTSYKLFGLTTGSSKTTVKHYLDQHMRNEELDLPRFLKVEVIDPRRKSGPIVYEGTVLDRVSKKAEGSFELEGRFGVDLPPPRENKPIHIIIKRYEIVNVPGLYTLVMPEMLMPDTAAGADRKPTIQVTVRAPLPAGVIPEVHTWFPTHQFTQDKPRYAWTFDGVMLAGQGFSIVFKASPPPPPPPPPVPQPELITSTSEAEHPNADTGQPNAGTPAAE